MLINLTIFLCLFGIICHLVLAQDSFSLECGKNMVFNAETMSCVSKKRRQASCPSGYKYNKYSLCVQVAYRGGK